MRTISMICKRRAKIGNKYMKKLRVFHGLSEIAGQPYYSVKGLRNLGIKTTHIVWEPSPFHYDYDVSLNIDKNKKNLLLKLPIWALKLFYYECKILRENNVFHFHFGRSLLLNYDLWIFHKIHKKVFFEFHGSDLRDYKFAKQLNKYMFDEGDDVVRQKLRKRTEKICKYADGIILHDDELIPHLPTKKPGIYVVPLRIDLQRILPVYVEKDRKKIRIVHAPTKRDVKGSDYLFAAFKSLEKKYEIELVIVENKTQEEALRLYKTADIIVDQLRIGTYGVFAVESMAMGKPVITYITEEMRQRLPEELPICSANPDTIKNILEKLIKDEALRYELGIKGRAYVEKYHDYRKNAKMLRDIYRGKINPIQGREAFDYVAKVL